ncbi:MAG TPA: hypothetical protein VHW09_27165 [Bryobacteraceae bacterium]|jgi:hypothetical protein|nr:hypothetical protein [Bryobacteraceae bacterium]
MTDSELSAFYKKVHLAYERTLIAALPTVKLVPIADTDATLAALGDRFSKAVRFEDADLTIEWPTNMPSPEAFARSLVQCITDYIRQNTVLSSETEGTPQIFLFHRVFPRSPLAADVAIIDVHSSDKTSLLGQTWYEIKELKQWLRFRVKYAASQLKEPEQTSGD